MTSLDRKWGAVWQNSGQLCTCCWHLPRVAGCSPIHVLFFMLWSWVCYSSPLLSSVLLPIIITSQSLWANMRHVSEQTRQIIYQKLEGYKDAAWGENFRFYCSHSMLICTQPRSRLITECKAGFKSNFKSVSWPWPCLKSHSPVLWLCLPGCSMETW